MHLRAYVRTTPRSNGSYLADLNIPNQNSVGSGASIESYGPQYHWMTSDNKVGPHPTSSSFTRASSANEMQLQFRRRTIFGNLGTRFDLNSSVCVASPDEKALTTSTITSFSDQCNKEDAEYYDATTGKELVLYRREGSQDVSLNTENCIDDKNLTFATSTKVDWELPEVTFDVRSSNSRKRAASTAQADRLRKARITEKLQSLQELLPNSGKGNKEVVLDDVIDYVKYLRLQLKALSQSRLGGEATSDPFIYLEGFGHFLVDQPTLNEPLEDTVGQMVEMDMPAVTKLLETKGLYVMPMSLADGLP
ncbi:hypothetical protein ACHQM5_027026 [Ranunculus cassubicifolius]